jgi:hypothetical protein
MCPYEDHDEDKQDDSVSFLRPAVKARRLQGKTCTGYVGHPFKNKPVETEKDLHPLLENRGW